MDADTAGLPRDPDGGITDGSRGPHPSAFLTRVEGAAGQDCQGEPATPVTVELAEPLGGREVVDGSIGAARPEALCN
jgi:hypothetical protein